MTEPDEPQTNLDGLAKAWADDECVRSLLLHKKSLLSWPSSKKTGVISFETMAQNARVLSKVLEIWCPQMEIPKTLSIDDAREQVRCSKNCYWTNLCLDGLS